MVALVNARVSSIVNLKCSRTNNIVLLILNYFYFVKIEKMLQNHLKCFGTKNIMYPIKSIANLKFAVK
jgi:hypothetical protein